MKISSLLFNLTLTRCINFIVNKYTSPSDFIILTSDRTDVDVPVARIDFRKGKIIDIESKSKPTFFIVENMKDSDIFSYWATVTRFPRMFFHPRARYLFIEEDFSPFYLRLFSRFNVYNSIFLNSKTGNIYTSFPFMNTNRKLRRNNAVHRIGKCDETSLLHDNLYPSKLPKDWQNQAMRIIFMRSEIYTKCVNCPRPGIEIEIITLILNQLKIFYHFYESQMNNENILLIEHRGYDFFIGTALSENTNLLEYTRSYVDDYMSWFVPMPKKLERWRYILLVFTPTTWILGFLSFVAIVSAFILVKTYKKPAYLNVTQFISVIFVGRIKRYRTENIPQEFLILCMVFLSFMVYNLFCSRLTFLLNGVNFSNSVNSFEDIVKSNLKIGIVTYENYLEKMKDFENFPKNRFEQCDDLDECLRGAKTYKDIVFLFACRPIRASKHMIMENETGLPFLKELKPYFFNPKFVVKFFKGHPFLPVLDRKLQYLIEFGITDKIIKNYDVPPWELPVLEPTQSLKMEHMVAPFIILGVRILMSLLAFSFEMRQFMNFNPKVWFSRNRSRQI
ncbi:hypothetical protein WA026_018445 [Henosepilachna vigintioctopunctata]|uniref:Ionotropic receptor n=1 Tax=Henosepilachna vigintioctopunctata TaxID=420089 RepID=A0AAW1UVC1_9CUCU